MAFALASCASSVDPREEEEWREYVKGLGQLEEPANPGKTPNPSETSTTWLDFYVASYDPWVSTGHGEFPHRPSWRAQRWLLRTAKERIRLPQPFLDLDPQAPRIPPEGIKFLVDSLDEPDWCRRSLCAFVLGAAGVEAKSSAPELLALLRDEHFMVRASAARALAEVGADRASTIPALREALRGEEFVRLSAAVALVKLKDEPPQVLPTLIDALRSPNDLIRARASACLSRIEGDVTVAIPTLIRCLGDTDPWVRGNAAHALGRMGKGAGASLPALETAAASDSDKDVRKIAAEAVKSVRGEK
jgi:hypothetical protein